MRAILGMLGLFMAVGIGYLIYSAGFGGGKGGTPPKQQIDVVGVRMELLSLAQAEKRHAASSGSFATLEKLQNEGSVLFKGSEYHGYTYEINVADDQHFQITARPSGSENENWPAFTIDETAQITELK
jgi:hypothetical protein